MIYDDRNCCAVCEIPLSRSAHEPCPSPGCPCFGTEAGSVEMEMAAERWRSRPSVAASRCMSGDAAVEYHEHRTLLDFMAAVGAL